MEEKSQSSNWWNTSRTSSFNCNTPTASSSLSSSAKTVASVTATSFMDSSLHFSSFSLSSSSPMDWSQSLLSNSSGRAESCTFHSMLEETATDTEEPSGITFRDMNDPLLLETGNCSRVTRTFLLTSSSSSFFDSQQMTNYQSQMIQKQSDINQLQFTRNSNFWNASDHAAMNEMRTGFCSSSDDVILKPFDLKPAGCSDQTVMNTEAAKEKKTRYEYTMKKPRMEETPSPLPAFKVRKEKLGDRITALQQLVSPFGKTDTASVLHEANEYIKFLYDQVNVLSTPYLKNGKLKQQRQKRSDNSNDEEQDLKSRGLCLVPIASAYSVASEISSDFWTPTFKGTYR
ncbi:transcription factor bHLH112 isoform X1 [Dendrobium catenatum]|uniref:transcription factor bHLH112 isoform X1 n=1 Tax=Dendrobium catenatum TaxID=906689 RepID=UPI0009F66A8E|nr:transcription factor bHLH112 isoform X1 [Dendrobium catenatum]